MYSSGCTRVRPLLGDMYEVCKGGVQERCLVVELLKDARRVLRFITPHRGVL